ncbi:YtxH domain-containing protein [Staphylococcus americanisciuri]|uniref:YtxH domain-containing protein n=1 Tax=Staphylococcus americanisciuri TaxID=2973940 RepID=A0ABT2F3Z5_9STAP|nr:YtxH domain-containing protein [Staphylococcus americanisciuri]MCS4487161.1 YtxH domain-containing protein [Staphylococcus americanisciuri]
MNAAKITLGLAVGVATGVSLVLMERQNQTLQAQNTNKKLPSDISNEVDTIQSQIHQIKDHALTIKKDGTDFAKSISGEIKTSIGEFKADITPNIQRLQKYLENIQNRGEEITNFPTKK